MSEALNSPFSFFLMWENEKQEFEQLDVKQSIGNYLLMNIH